MAQAVILITASRGCWILGSGTVSTRTSPLPCQHSARIAISIHGTACTVTGACRQSATAAGWIRSKNIPSVQQGLLLGPQISNQRGAWENLEPLAMLPIEKVKEDSRCCGRLLKRGCGKLVEPQGCQARRCAGLLFRLFHRSYNRHRIAVAGLFFGREAVSGQVAASIKDMLGDSGANAVQAMLADAGRPEKACWRLSRSWNAPI